MCVRLCYVQSLTGHKSPVNAVSASETTGDIATVCDSGELCFHVEMVVLSLSFQLQCKPAAKVGENIATVCIE